MSDLKLSLLQTSVSWEDREANIAHFEKLLEKARGSDIILLPEMFTTGFSMNAEKLAEPYPGETLKWLEKQAKKLGACIAGSVITHDEGKYFNRLLWAYPSGLHAFYDKRHTFTFAGEDKVYSKGQKKVVLDWNGWQILPLICYDLRFPVWSRNHAIHGYDLVLYVANWPTARVSAWDALLPARAIENASYSVGVNRIGEDGNGIAYSGHSAVYNYLGHRLNDESEKEEIISVTLSKNKLQSYRKKFPVLNDMDPFEVGH